MLYRPGLLGRLPCPQDWYMPSAPPTIDVSFAGSLPSGWAFTRASVGTDSTYLDAPGQQTYNTLAPNAPLIDQWGIKVEPQSTNYYLNSDAPALQQIACTGGQVLVIWFVGTSNAQVNLTVMSGTFSNVGSVLPNTWRTVTCNTSGNLQVNVFAGTVYRIQCETNSSNLPTSYIVTGGTPQTRQETRLNANFFGGQLNVNNGTYWLEFMATSWHNSMLMSAGVGSYTQPNETDDIMMSGASIPRCAVVAPANSVNALLLVGGVFSAMGINRVAMSYTPTRIAACGNYGTVGSTVASARPATLIAITLGNGGGGLLGTYPLNGYIRGFRYWSSTMSDQELHECTGAGYYGGKPVFDLDGTVANQWRMWSNQRTAGSGVITDATMDQPNGTAFSTYTQTQSRFTSRGLLTDWIRANLFPTPGDVFPASGTTPSLTVQGYIVSMRGSGSITINQGTGIASATTFPLVVTRDNPKAFYVTTGGTFTWTTSGSVELAQLEGVGAQLQYPGALCGPTAYIRTTVANQTRAAETVQLLTGPWFNSNEYTFYTEVNFLACENGYVWWSADDLTSGTASGNNRDNMIVTVTNGNGVIANNRLASGVGQGSLPYPPNGITPITNNTWHKVAHVMSVSRGLRWFCVDGIIVGPNPIGAALAAPIARMMIGSSASMLTRRIRYYDYPILDAALAALTT